MGILRTLLASWLRGMYPRAAITLHQTTLKGGPHAPMTRSAIWRSGAMFQSPDRFESFGIELHNFRPTLTRSNTAGNSSPCFSLTTAVSDKVCSKSSLIFASHSRLLFQTRFALRDQLFGSESSTLVSELICMRQFSGCLRQGVVEV